MNEYRHIKDNYILHTHTHNICNFIYTYNSIKLYIIYYSYRNFSGKTVFDYSMNTQKNSLELNAFCNTFVL